MAEVLLYSGDTAVLRCPLFGQAVSIGASPANDISIPDASLPPLYCSFEPMDGTDYRVVDRGGQGLVFDGKKVVEHVLEDGDEWNIGHLRARYQASKKKPVPRDDQRTGILRTKGSKLVAVEMFVLSPSGERIEIDEGGVRIGADASNDVVVQDGFVSSHHAQLFWRGERLFVRDLDSTNGTKVSGVQIVEAEVLPDSKLQVGQTELEIVPVEKPAVVETTSKGPWQLGELRTQDAAFAKTFAMVRKVAPHDATVCVFGETGTGKELVAHALHAQSGRASENMVALNCAAIPESLIESELFGHEKGAFTGADRQHLGVFEQAHGGTLFLDEVGELPLDVQAKLLRVLEIYKVRRVGGTAEIPVDVRIVAATHRDLVAHVAEGRFREDLLHRLWVIPIRLSPLRERPADISYLAQHFASALSPIAQKKLSAQTKTALERHPYPGNVRELRNVIQRALIIGADDDKIVPEDIQFIPVSLTQAAEAGGVYRRGMTMEEVERTAFEGALAAYPSAAEAARSLGLPKSTFWRRANALGLVGEQK